MPETPPSNALPTAAPYGTAQFANVVAAVRELQHPTRVGPYYVQKILGEGGMGTVYLAEQREPVRREVALKLIKLGMDTREVIARFESERQALAMMNHPNVARVLDAGATETGRPYFVMEYVAGEPITSFADRHKLTVEQRLELFQQACEAVQHAHQKAIIHRDLKPSNILVCFQDGKAVVKVIDFGVAKALNQRLTEKTLFTETGQLLGTPEYMSPEQAESNALDVDTRADVYSLGVVLYELLSGALPFDVRSLRSAGYHEIQRIIREVEPPSPSTRLSSLQHTLPTIAAARQLHPGKLGTMLKGELDWIVMKAMEKDRARRYASAGELVADVSRYLADEPVAAGPPSRVYRARKFIHRHRWGLAMGTLLAGVVVAGFIGTTWGLIKASHQRDQAIAARKAEAEAREYEEQTDKFLIEMFTSIKPEEARGRDVLVKEILDRAAQRVDTNPPKHKIVEAYLRKIFGDAYRSLGLLEPAQHHLERSLQLDSPSDVVSQQRVGSTLNVLGLTYSGLGKLDQAEAALRQALDLQRKAKGADDVEAITTQANLGVVLMLRQKYAEADTILCDALDRSARATSMDPFARASVGNSLAELRTNQGRQAEAEQIYRSVLADSIAAYGDNHPASIGAMANLADLLRQEGKYAQAVEMQTRAYDLARKVFGPDHPDTLTAANNLGLALQFIGRLDEALKIYTDAVARSRRVLGEDHPATLNLRSNVGLLLQTMNRLDEAEAEFRDVLARQQHAIGDADPNTITTQSNLAGLLAIRGDLAGAEQVYRQLIPVAEKAFAPGHPAVALFNLKLGFVLTQEGKWGEAEPLLAASFARAKELGITAISPGYKVAWGICLVNLGRADEARPVLQDAEKSIPALSGIPKPLAAMLADAYAKLGEAEKAQRWRQSATQPASTPMQTP